VAERLAVLGARANLLLGGVVMATRIYREDDRVFVVDRVEVATVNDVQLENAAGTRGRSTVHKFGYSDLVTNVESDVWEVGGLYTGFFEQAQQVFVISGGNAQDSQTISGTGAWDIKIEGLNASFQPASETLSLNGGTQSAASTNAYSRVFRAYVNAVGAYGGTNAGNITIAGTAASGTMARIATGLGQTEQAVYCVPSGKLGYLTQFDVNVAGTKAANIKLYQRPAAADVSSPFIAKRLISRLDDVAGQATVSYSSYPVFTGPTDIWASAEKTSAGTVEVTATFDLILVDA
jgi:hypothetical protein